MCCCPLFHSPYSFEGCQAPQDHLSRSHVYNDNRRVSGQGRSRHHIIKDKLQVGEGDARRSKLTCSGRYLIRITSRTHKAILAVANAFRKILARSFQVANPSEEALINGDLPEMLSVRSLNELAPDNCFRGSNVVFVAPDELVGHLRSRFNDNGLSNDV